jgi:hypothetical protein
MGTRAVISVGDFHIFKHWDGYPSGIAEVLTKTLPLAWKLPRFEEDEFAAAFVAAAKTAPGGVRIMSSRHEAADVEYGYTIHNNKIKVVQTNYWDDKTTERPVFTGTFSKFIEKYHEAK